MGSCCTFCVDYCFYSKFYASLDPSLAEADAIICLLCANQCPTMFNISEHLMLKAKQSTVHFLTLVMFA